MNIYRYLKVASSKFLPDWAKIFGLWMLYVCKRRMIGVFLDPVMACNFRCKMCYMSDPLKRSEMRGQILANNDVERIGNALYSRALKLQIGCATEPTLYPHLPKLITDAKTRGVPYISLTSNGKLIATGRVSLMQLAEVGLNELTLSMHGSTRETYEYLMPGSNFDDLLKLSKIVADVKRVFPDFKLRVNYTINAYNAMEVSNLFAVFGEGALPDVIQLRPVQNLGDTEWQDFDLTLLKDNYDSTIGAVARQAAAFGIQCIVPTLGQLDEVATDQDGVSTIINDMTYCYVSPEMTYKSEFLETDTYDSYHSRHSTGRRLLRLILSNKSASRPNGTKHLN